MASNTIAPTASTARASDDEILGLAPNTIRKSNRVVGTKNMGEKLSATSPQAQADDFLAGLESAGGMRTLQTRWPVMPAKKRRTFALTAIRKS